MRYARQLSVPGWGEAQQNQLQQCRALVVGLGGLGCATALYLAAAGIGSLRLVDDDVVEASNLSRQILYDEQQVGQRKVTAAQKGLRNANPQIMLETIGERLTAANVNGLAEGCDLVLDCSDNQPTRAAICAWSVARRGIHLYGSVRHWDGQLAAFAPASGACWGCLLGESADLPHEPAGVMTPLPGIIGTRMALETLKILGGVTGEIGDYLHHFDGVNGTWERLEVRRNPVCRFCGG